MSRRLLVENVSSTSLKLHLKSTIASGVYTWLAIRLRNKTTKFWAAHWPVTQAEKDKDEQIKSEKMLIVFFGSKELSIRDQGQSVNAADNVKRLGRVIKTRENISATWKLYNAYALCHNALLVCEFLDKHWMPTRSMSPLNPKSTGKWLALSPSTSLLD